MEEFLRVIQEPVSTSTEAEMDPENLKIFTSKLKIWDYTKVSAREFQNRFFENKSKIFREYSAEMSTKYLGKFR